MNFYKIARSLLFKLDAEKAHDVSINGLRALQSLGLTPILEPNLKNNPINIMGLNFPNRIGLAADWINRDNVSMDLGQWDLGLLRSEQLLQDLKVEIQNPDYSD